MEAFKVFQTAQDLLFGICVGPSDIRRRLIDAFMPWRVHASLQRAAAADAGEASPRGMPPIVFWLFVVAVPQCLMFEWMLRTHPTDVPAIQWIAGQPWTMRCLALTLLLASWPISSAQVLGKYSASKDRTTVRRLFETNCVVLTPASLILLASVLATAALHEQARPLNTFMMCAFLIAVAYSQIAMVFCEVRSGWLDRIDAAVSCTFRGFIQWSAVLIVWVLMISATSGKLQAALAVAQ